MCMDICWRRWLKNRSMSCHRLFHRLSLVNDRFGCSSTMNYWANHCYTMNMSAKFVLIRCQIRNPLEVHLRGRHSLPAWRGFDWRTTTPMLSGDDFLDRYRGRRLLGHLRYVVSGVLRTAYQERVRERVASRRRQISSSRKETTQWLSNDHQR